MEKRLSLFPISSKLENDTLSIAGCDLATLADTYGTPLYLYDRAELDHAAGQYRRSLTENWPGPWSVTYAGKAFLCGWVAGWAGEHGFTIDCTGLGEIAIAVHAGVKKEQVLVHGVNKSDEDLLAAFEHAGTIVVDNLHELKRILRLRDISPHPVPDLWLRLLPGLAVETHHSHTQTGHAESKFGMGFDDFLQAVRFCRENHLPFNGIHFHQGSQFHDPTPLVPAIESALDLALELNMGEHWHLCPGGGWGVAYHEDELPNPSIEEYVQFVTRIVRHGIESRKLSMPHLHLEPGRSLVARAGVAMYRIGTVKRSAGRTWILVDGGMADNPRHALYGARYSALTVRQASGSVAQNVWVAGPFCESGDVIIENLPLGDVHEGDLLAVPVSGAYHLSMSSNYNGARRPAALVLENGQARLILKRETAHSLLMREP